LFSDMSKQLCSFVRNWRCRNISGHRSRSQAQYFSFLAFVLAAPPRSAEPSLNISSLFQVLVLDTSCEYPSSNGYRIGSNEASLKLKNSLLD
jgi:hypothetical protein